MQTRNREELEREEADDATEATEEEWQAANLIWSGYRLSDDTDDAREPFAGF